MLRELRRRRVLRTGALYVIGSWLCLQVADVLFPAFGIPERAIGALVWTAVAGFPIALLFGWFFDIGPGGIRRTLPAGADGASEAQPLARSDYLILAAFAGVAATLVYNAARDVSEVPSELPASMPLDAALGAPEGVRPKLANSIAVLPFANISNDPDNDYFCDGVSEEILHELGGFRELNVIGRTSSFVFKDSDFGVPRISGLLGVKYVLQGSVRKQGEQLRIAAQLLDEHGVQVWSERFDRQLANVFDIQSEIAAAVARNVASHLTSAAPAGHLPPIEAYDLFLRARKLLHQRDWAEPLALLERVIKIDDRFAEAHAEIAIAHIVADDSEESLHRARRAIDRALELEPRLLRARAAEGLWLLSRSPADAERVLRAVLDQDPNSSDALLWLSNALSMQGRLHDSRQVLERAARIDPLHPSITSNLANALVRDGETDAAIEMVRRQRELPEVGNVAMFRLAVMLRQLGRLVEQNEHAKFMVLRGRDLGYPVLAHSYRLLGDWPKAIYWFERASVEMGNFEDAPFFRTVRPPGQEAVSLEEFRQVLAQSGRSLSEQPASIQIWYGALLSRAGHYEEAIEILEPLIDPAGGAYHVGGLFELDGLHALAWAYRQTGEMARSQTLLQASSMYCSETQTLFSRHDADGLYLCAVNALLRRDTGLALDALERAIDIGWSAYYVQKTDPYWTAVADDPRYRAMMARVRANVDRQRAQVERVDAAEDFVAKLAAVRRPT
ncbi:MAG TPA: tetratricopeptide repeat protein [Steroidobacteraceae bacterium]|nr:tetratricopeptide repeat protein [Steroidobacteraceae bacterium]